MVAPIARRCATVSRGALAIDRAIDRAEARLTFGLVSREDDSPLRSPDASPLRRLGRHRLHTSLRVWSLFVVVVAAAGLAQRRRDGRARIERGAGVDGMLVSRRPRSRRDEVSGLV
jgi:hypothetical protein